MYVCFPSCHLATQRTMRMSNSAEKIAAHSHAPCGAKPSQESKKLSVLVLPDAVIRLGSPGLYAQLDLAMPEKVLLIRYREATEVMTTCTFIHVFQLLCFSVCCIESAPSKYHQNSGE